MSYNFAQRKFGNAVVSSLRSYTWGHIDPYYGFFVMTMVLEGTGVSAFDRDQGMLPSTAEDCW